MDPTTLGTQQNQGGAIIANDGTQLDPTVVNLAKAIRTIESGGQYGRKGKSGEVGAYQFMPDTWKNLAQQHLGDPNAPKTAVNQDKAAYYQIKAWKDQGYAPQEIASMWNAGQGKPDAFATNFTGTNAKGVAYDTPAYVNKVMDSFQSIKGGQQPPPWQPPLPAGANALAEGDAASAAKFKPSFAATTENPSMLKEAAKTVGNIPSSIFGFAKGAVNMVTHPIDTVKNIFQHPIESLVPEAARDLVGAGINAIQGKPASDQVLNAERAITNDPFGQIFPFIAAGEGGAKLADNIASKASMADYVKNISKNIEERKPIPQPSTAFSGALDKVGSTLAAPITKPLGYVFGKAPEAVGNLIKGGVSKTTGMEVNTIDQAMAGNLTPETLSSMNRAGLGETVRSSLEGKAADLEETGKVYGDVRASGAKVKVNPNYLEDTFKETTGVEIKKGAVQTSGGASIRDAGDIRALQNLYDTWKPEFKKGYLTSDEFLNFRTDLAKIAKYGRELTSSKPLENLSSIMRGKFNTAYRGQLNGTYSGMKGLQALDETFGPQAAEYRSISKGLVDKDGNLTPAAINRIANAAGKGKDVQLAKLEKVSPGITKKIQVLKAVEDIQHLAGPGKVGTYTKTAAGIGGAVAGLATGNLPLLAGSLAEMVLTSPSVALKIIKSYGQAAPVAAAVIDKLKTMGIKVNELPDSIGAKALPAQTVFGRASESATLPQ